MRQIASIKLLIGLAPSCLVMLAHADSASDEDYYRRACGGGYAGTLTLAQASPAPGQPPGEASTPPRPPAPSSEAVARSLVDKMLAAHGGLGRWRRARTFRFTHTLTFGEPLRAEWFISEELTEIATRRTYHDWPLYGGRLGHDGKRTWTRDWKIENPPGVNVNAAYEVLALPWLTQERGVRLQHVGERALPGAPQKYQVIRMTFDPSRGESPHKYFDLYLHPETHLLLGVAYDITYGGFLDLIGLPKGKPSLGPFVHVFYRHVQVDGLKLPAQYDTFDPSGKVAGRHAVYGYSLTGPFDESRMKVGKGDVIDRTTAARRP